MAYLRALRAAQPRQKQFDPQELVQQLGDLQQQAAVREYQQGQLDLQRTSQAQKQAQFEATQAAAAEELRYNREQDRLKAQREDRDYGLRRQKFDAERGDKALEQAGEMAKGIAAGEDLLPVEPDPEAAGLEGLPAPDDVARDRAAWEEQIRNQAVEDSITQQAMAQYKIDEPQARAMAKLEMGARRDLQIEQQREQEKQERAAAFQQAQIDESKARTTQTKANTIAAINQLPGPYSPGALVINGSQMALDMFEQLDDAAMERYARKHGLLKKGQKFDRIVHGEELFKRFAKRVKEYGTYGKGKSKKSLPGYSDSHYELNPQTGRYELTDDANVLTKRVAQQIFLEAAADLKKSIPVKSKRGKPPKLLTGGPMDKLIDQIATGMDAEEAARTALKTYDKKGSWSKGKAAWATLTKTIGYEGLADVEYESLKSQWQNVLNKIIKNRSGAAVTDQEMKRLYEALSPLGVEPRVLYAHMRTQLVSEKRAMATKWRLYQPDLENYYTGKYRKTYDDFGRWMGDVSISRAGEAEYTGIGEVGEELEEAVRGTGTRPPRSGNQIEIGGRKFRIVE